VVIISGTQLLRVEGSEAGSQSSFKAYH